MTETRKRAPRKAAAKSADEQVETSTDAPETETDEVVAGSAHAEGVVKAFKDHGIDASKVPANNAIYTDGYITVEPLGGTERPRLNPWPSEKARADVFAAWWTAEGAKV